MKSKIKFLDTSCNVFITDKDEHCQKHWAAGNFYESQRNGLLQWANAEVHKGGIYIDIGANIGNHTLFMWTVLEAKRVISIEADANHIQQLIRNLSENDIPVNDCYRVALSDFDGRGRLEYDSTPTTQGGAMMGRLVEDKDGEIEVRKFDSLPYLPNERVTWMKLDIEGSEFNALVSASGFLKFNKPLFISCECMKESDFVLINSLLTIFGYNSLPIKLNHTPTYVWKHKDE